MGTGGVQRDGCDQEKLGVMRWKSCFKEVA